MAVDSESAASQMDTLSYLMLGASLRHGLFGEVQGQCKGVAAVHRSCKNDTAEHVARAFDRGNYSKGAEVDRFQVLYCMVSRAVWSGLLLEAAK